MKKNINSNKAFSLIELSIVILIIGILVAGVTSSSRLVKRMKLMSAQNITKSSPVPTIKDLTLWYETTLDESFDNAEESDATPITSWFDMNTQSSYKVNGSQPTLANKPKYTENVINGLPSIFFDGVDDHIIVNSAGISGKGLSIFIVSQRKALGTFQGLISGINPLTMNDEASNAGGFQAFYDGNGGAYITLSGGVWYSAVAQTVPRDNVPFIASTFFNGTNNIGYLNTNVGSTVAGAPIFNVDRLYIGSRYVNNPTQYYWGYISEIIIFNRGLNTEERLAVTSYLSKKYAIKVS
jgi:prepilin-type N-terminal cleavage/methylation domain-containing protein